jgi:uncharacterized protein (TIGR02646 family)
MIKLERTSCPVELTEQLKNELTQKFKDNKEVVWNKKFIKDTLFEMSDGKCCFCETNLGEEGKFMNVEHFHHKDKYQDEVVEWNNLLPSCGRCNINKGVHDTVVEPILNPTIDCPREHFVMKNYRLKSKPNSKLGKATIEVLYLNDTEGLVIPRFEIGNQVHIKIEDILNLAIEYTDGTNRNTRRRNRIVNGIKDVLREALPQSQYSATVATVILSDSDYNGLKRILIDEELWDEELISMENSATNICFDIIS